MNVILLKNVTNLGNVGDCVDVKPGFARNDLIPKQKAIPANETNMAVFETQRASLEKQADEALADAKKRSETLKTVTLLIKSQASDEGKLFGSITPREIAAAYKKEGHEVSKQAINMPEGPIRTTGEYTINLQLHGEVSFDVVIQIEA
jgi:large subunit ribosomal protein L9